MKGEKVMKEEKKLSVVVPCYNEERNVGVFYNELIKVFQDYSVILEVIFINDGSKDNTLMELKKLLTNKESEIKILALSRNFGKESAIYAGLEASTGDFVAIIDADMQQNPALLKDMLNILVSESDYDSVALYQEQRKEGFILSFFKRRFYNIINKMSEIDFFQGASDFRMFKRSMVNSILKITENNRFSKGIFSWAGFNTYYMPYKVEERMYGESNWSFWKLFKYAISGIVSFSTAPLRFSTILGSVIGIISFIYLVVIIIEKIVYGVAIPGYPTIVGLILLLGGIQLICIGIIGEYLARAYMETKNRPIYLLRGYYTNTGIEEENNLNK